MMERFWENNQQLKTGAAQQIKFSIKDFFSKCDQSARNCGFGHINWRDP